MARTLFRQLGSWISGVRTRQARHNGVSAISPSLRQNSRVADARLLCVIAGVAATASSATLGFHGLHCGGSIHPSPHTTSTGAASGSPTERGLDSKIIDGRAVAAQTRLHVASTVAEMRRCYGKVPKLAVVVVGSKKASGHYVRHKQSACEEVGIDMDTHYLSEQASEEQVIEVVRGLSQSPDVDGLLVQLPLPKHVNTDRVMATIDPVKDVDGLSPGNGTALFRGAHPHHVSCTASAALALIRSRGCQVAGKRAVVLGRSNVVGLPLSLLLLRMDATVTVCHSKTQGLADVVREADIVVAAAGKPELVQPEWLKQGALVIDVGYNVVPDASGGGFRVCGDVLLNDETVRRASAITPVPGGVGPMTVATLLEHTVTAARYRLQKE